MARTALTRLGVGEAARSLVASIKDQGRDKNAAVVEGRKQMRSYLTIALALLASGSAFALEANDTMARWKGASAEDKDKLVAALLDRDGKKSLSAKVIKCLDEAADVSGHADLTIVRVAKACAENGSEPV